MKINDSLPPSSQSIRQHAPRVDTDLQTQRSRPRGETVEEVQKMADEELQRRVEEEVDEFNETIEGFMVKDLKFQIHDESDRFFVQVVDVIEDEVIKEMPPEEFLDMKARIQDVVGIVIDELV